MSCYNDHIVIMFYHTNFGGAKFMHHNLGYKNTPVRLRRSFFFRTDAVFATSTTDRGIFIPQRYYLWTWVGEGRENRKSFQEIWNVDRWNLWCWNENATSYPFPPNQAFLSSLLQNLGIFSENLTISMNKYNICCCERPVEHYWALLKHDYGIFTELSYQILQNQGFPDHHFELRKLQGIMQNFSYKFHSFCFLLNVTWNIYHSYQILISDSPRSRLPGSLLQTQGTSRYCATLLSQISFLPLSIKSDIINIYISFVSNPHIRFL